MKTIQQILNDIRVDENGDAITVKETSQQAFNAVYDPDSNAIRVNIAGGGGGTADTTKLGAWDSTTSYVINDLTTDSGGIYIALTANTNSQPSLNPDDWEPYQDTIEQVVALGSKLYLDDADSDIIGYHVLLDYPAGGTEEEDSVIVNNNTVLIESYATPAGGLGITEIPADLWIFDFYCSVSSTVGTTEILADVYKRDTGGTETLLFSVTTGDINSTTPILKKITSVQPAYPTAVGDRLVVKMSGKTSRTTNTTVSFFHNGTEHYSHIETPSLATHNQLSGLNDGDYQHLTAAEYSALHAHTNKSELDLISDGDHDVRTDNPHATDIGNLGGGSLAELNIALSDATLIDTGDSRLSDARTPTAHASTHISGTDDIQSATASQKGLATATQIAKLNGIESGAVSNWHPITAFTATPASTSTLTMTSDLTSLILPGRGLKYTISAVDYYGICTAITSNLLTVAGVPLSGDVTALYWTHILPITKEYQISGEFADSADTALLENDLLINGGDKWQLGKAYLVNLAISTFQDDSGATTQPAINVSIAGSDVLSTALTIPDGTYTQSVVQIATANYDINYGEAIELSVTAASGGTPGNDALDLFAILIFIPEIS